MTTALTCKLISEQNAERYWWLRIVNELNESYAMKSKKIICFNLHKKITRQKKESQPNIFIYQHDDFQSRFGQIMNELSPNRKHDQKKKLKIWTNGDIKTKDSNWRMKMNTRTKQDTHKTGDSKISIVIANEAHIYEKIDLLSFNLFR